MPAESLTFAFDPHAISGSNTSIEVSIRCCDVKILEENARFVKPTADEHTAVTKIIQIRSLNVVMIKDFYCINK